MRALALVTRRELRAYAPAWIAALVAALLPWLAPLLPNANSQPAAEVRLGTALVLAVLLGLVFALFAGAGLLARDLAEGRMGFFLALPLRAGTVWAGRVLAATILVLGSMAAIALPAAFAAGELSLRPEAFSGSALLSFLGPLIPAAAVVLLPPLFLVLLAHLFATALRSRSPWLLVDLAGLALCGLLVARSLTRLVRGGAPIELVIASGLAAALALAALLWSGGVGLARGGVLLSRVHRAQAVVVAAGLLAAALATAGYAQWVLAGDADDVTAAREVEAAPNGPWVAVRGPLRHRPSYVPWLLLDVRNGASLPLGPAVGGLDSPLPPVAFSSDGRRAAWLRPQGAPYGSPNDAVAVDLGDSARPHEAGVEVARGWGTSLLVDGDRLAVAEPGRLSVWTDDGRQLLAAADLPRKQASWQQLRVLPGGVVRLARLTGIAETVRLQVWDLDVAARRLLPRVDREVGPSDAAPRAALSADGARLLLTHGWGGRGGIELADAATGATITWLVAEGGLTGASAGFLAGARIAVAVGRDGALVLHLHDRDGARRRELPLGEGRWAWLAAPWSADRLPYTAYARRGGSLQHELRVVDLANGQVRTLGARLAPVGGASPWWPGDDRITAGAPASRLFHDGNGALVSVDDNGRQTRVLPRPG